MIDDKTIREIDIDQLKQLCIIHQNTMTAYCGALYTDDIAQIERLARECGIYNTKLQTLSELMQERANE